MESFKLRDSGLSGVVKKNGNHSSPYNVWTEIKDGTDQSSYERSRE